MSEVALPSTPADLFLVLWAEAEGWRPDERAAAPLPSAVFLQRAREALDLDDGPEAYAALRKLMSAETEHERRGQALGLLGCIDQIFERIHPRGLVGAVARARIPLWLKDARDQRDTTGCYGEGGERRLLPRGPLRRPPRCLTATSADSLEDRFPSLCVTPKTLHERGRQVTVELRRVSASLTVGIEPTLRRGSERVVFIPVAEAAEHLEAHEQMRGAARVADFRPGKDFDPVARLAQALALAGPADIALAPELVLPESDADRLAEALREVPVPCGLVLAGTGATKDPVQAPPWNEARLLNGQGAELWRQRKIWPAGWNQDRARDLGLSDPGSGLVMEDNAAGDSIAVVDTDGLGRCVVLICQDIKCSPLALDTVRVFQPDWVLVPILDAGIQIGRWVHQACWDLSEHGQSRFLVVSSTSLASRLKLGPVAHGLAVGPKEPAQDDKDDITRAVAILQAAAGIDPAFAAVTWREGDEWLQTQLGAAPPRKN